MSRHKGSSDAAADRRHDRVVPDGDADFSAATELENLRSEVVQIEAVARAAADAMEELPLVTDREGRRAFGRVEALVSMTADVAAAVMEHSDAVQARLNRHLANRRRAG